MVKAITVETDAATALSQLPGALAVLQPHQTKPKFLKSSSVDQASRPAPSSSNDLDSGYVSQVASAGTTPDGKNIPKHFPGLFGRLSKKKSPLFFNKAISPAAQSRLTDISELISQPLHDFLTKAKVDSISTRNIAMKLKWSGPNELAAELRIIVSCTAAAAPKVTAFFKQDWVVEECIPSTPDPDFPPLKPLVWPRAPRLLAAVFEVFGEPVKLNKEMYASLGTSLEVTTDGKSRMGTIGGIVQVISAGEATSSASGPSTIYGMTACHILSEASFVEDDFSDEDEEYQTDPEPPTPTPHKHSISGDENENQNTLDPVQAEVDSMVSAVTATQYLAQNTSNDDAQWVDDPWLEISVFSTACGPKNDRVPHRNLDWCLLTVFALIPSRVPKTLVSQECFEFSGSEERAYLDSATGGKRYGTISATMSTLVLAPGTEFVKTYTFVPDEDTILKEGDSGSWIIDDTSGDVFGHLVAVDYFGDGYVIPLRDTLDDIAESLNLPFGAVKLPTPEEFNKTVGDKLFNKLFPSANRSVTGDRKINIAHPTTGVDSGYVSLEPTPQTTPSNQAPITVPQKPSPFAFRK